jgi:ubiquinone/menaquinone biosynthesis C-methylase UbiE
VHNRPVVAERQTSEEFDREAARIRAVYAERDRRPARSRAIAKAYELINAERLAKMRSLIGELPTPHPRLLNVGCGAGLDLEFWGSEGWPVDALAGVDLVEARVSQARVRCPDVDVRVANGTSLPFPNAAFDVATAVTVLSSILDEAARAALFEEMCRVVRPQGLVVVYDFVVRKPGNRDVVPMDYRRLLDLGRVPSTSRRLTPLLHLVAIGSLFGDVGTRVTMALAPPTHRLTAWQMPAVAPAAGR